MDMMIFYQNFAIGLGLLFGSIVFIKVLKIDKLMEKLI